MPVSTLQRSKHFDGDWTLLTMLEGSLGWGEGGIIISSLQIKNEI